MLILPGTVQNEGLQGAGNYQVTISKKNAELQLLGRGWLGPQHPARQAAPSQAPPALL